MEWLKRIRKKAPLIECLTNFVTVNDVANTILSVGASPVMCVEKTALEEMVAMSSSVVLNIGTMTRGEMPSYETAMSAAAKYGVCVVLDPVGAGATHFATETALHLLSEHPCGIIRCNASELHAIAGRMGGTRGVDAASADEVCDERLEYFAELGQRIAGKYGCIVAMSGAIDVISNKEYSVCCRNGVPMMSKVTGTGCSLTGLTAAFAGTAESGELFDAAIWATAMMGSAGDIAFVRAGHVGLGTFHCALLDALSVMDDAKLVATAKLEKVNVKG